MKTEALDWHNRWVGTHKCILCKAPAVEGLEFEGGNNAEFSCTFWVCEKHLEEYDKDEYAFQDKYASHIDDECYDTLIAQAD